MSQITRAERIQAALFLLIGLVVTGSVVLTLVGLRFGKTPRTYYLRFSDTVTGLNPGAPVRYKGVKYGKVDSIRVDQEHPEIIQVALALDEEAPIRVSTTAVIATESILGPYHIELRGSRGTSPFLPSGSYIPASATTLAKLLATGETLGDQLVQVLANLEQWTDEPHRKQFWETVAEVERTLETTRLAIEKLQPDAARLLKESADLAEWALDFLQRNGPQAEKLLTDLVASVRHVEALLSSGTIEETTETFRTALGRAADEVDRSGAAFRKWMEENQVAPYLARAVESLERLEKDLTTQLDGLSSQTKETLRSGVTPALRELRETSAALGRLIKILERQPRALIFGEPPARKPLPGEKR